jgi:hypothetical protein
LANGDVEEAAAMLNPTCCSEKRTIVWENMNIKIPDIQIKAKQFAEKINIFKNKSDSKPQKSQIINNGNIIKSSIIFSIISN